jgi:hypothetical protein
MSKFVYIGWKIQDAFVNINNDSAFMEKFRELYDKANIEYNETDSFIDMLLNINKIFTPEYYPGINIKKLDSFQDNNGEYHFGIILNEEMNTEDIQTIIFSINEACSVEGHVCFLFRYSLGKCKFRIID